ncbi:MAG: hypothetical protein GC171_16475 [Terrimonas sp.]|nr:hypothetical protein [Terrimonas sp.]
MTIIAHSSFSQSADSIESLRHFSGTVSVTNNGISLVPNFSLGKPAALALLSLGGKRFSFDPDIRFSLKGKPWTFLFWARYKLFTEGRFKMNTGVHLGMNFRTSTLPVNNVPTETIVLRRYLASELAPNYWLAKNISIGAYYLYSRGIDDGTVKNTHFITLNSNFTRIPLIKKIYLRAAPQVYFLNQDGKKGYYFNSTFALAKEDFPLAVTSTLNRELHSNIIGSKKFIWNLSLVYSFSKNLILKPAH